MAALTEVIVILLLILGNGIFAMAEIAVVSAQRLRLQQRAETGNKGAAVALALARQPGPFLSTVQIGITLVGVLAGAFGGATLAEELATLLARVPWLAPRSEAISVTVVVICITYLTLVLGELAPKQLALRDTERVAAAMAPAMQTLSRVAAPAVRILSRSTELVVRLFGAPPDAEPPVTEEEIRVMIRMGAQAGVLKETESELADHIFMLDDRTVDVLMTPRLELVWLDLDAPDEEIKRVLSSSSHSRFPVAVGHLDRVVGVVYAKDLLVQLLAGRPLDVKAALRRPLFVPESMPSLSLLDHFKSGHKHTALVIDEYGGFQGMVTINDLVETIFGEIPLPEEVAEPEAFQREDGSWLVDGRLPIVELKELLALPDLPDEEKHHYLTVGGLVISVLERIPAAGDHFELGTLRFEVMDMDKYRVDKVLITPLD